MALFNITRYVILPLLTFLCGPACVRAAAPPATSPPASATGIYQAWPYDAQEAARRQEATARVLGTSKEITVDLGGKTQLKFVLIPAGRFMMGTKEAETVEHWKDESLHEVVISKPFYMGRYHVTQAQWRAVMGTTVAQQRGKKGGLPPNQPATVSFNDRGKFTYPKGWGDALAGEGEDHPMYFVTWNEATEFCRRVSEKTGRTVRLPTEAQWEYAAQAGSKERFFFGADAKALGEYAWHTGNDGFTTHREGEKKPNPFGLYDIQGNVWAWCSDWYGVYPPGPVTDPAGPAAGDGHILRGGGWTSGWGGCRCADRFRLPADERRNYVGFRVSSEFTAPARSSSHP